MLEKSAQFRFAAAIGKDWVGDRILEILSYTPVNSRDFILKNSRTPFTNVLSDPGFNEGRGERTFINNIGGAGEISPDDLPEDFLDADILALGGTAIVPTIHDRLDEILDKADETTFKLVNTVFDFRNEQRYPGQPWPIGKDHRSFESIDLLIMDREEALKISGMKSLEQAIRYFVGSPLKAFMVTDGTGPVWIYTNPSGNDLQEPVCLPVFPEIFGDAYTDGLNADTTGAGDNFTGGVIYSVASQIAAGIDQPDLVEAAKWGIVSGGYACTYMGGTFLENSGGEKMEAITSYYDLYQKHSGGE